jgi:spore germination protein YaaH
MRKIWWWGIGILLLILGMFFCFKINKEIFLNPLSGRKVENKMKNDLVTFGFLPTWMVGKTRVYGGEVSHLIFLGIESDEEGNLIWDVQSKKINGESFLTQKQKTKESEGKVILGVKLFDDKKLKILLSDEVARKNLISQIKEVVDTSDFDGVNLDFEFQNDPLEILGDDFGVFLNELSLEGVGEISVDVFANTIIKGNKEKLEKMISKIDYLVVMAYDFSRPGVNYVGAVAPIGSEVGKRNISEVVENYLTFELDKSKLIMAYPLYGYEWKTETADFGSKIKRGWYQMASWNRTKELIKEKNLTVNWDELSMSPWLSFEEEGEIHQIYFENGRSLKAKIDLVRQNQFKGFGYWALGYEGEETVIWDW